MGSPFCTDRHLFLQILLVALRNLLLEVHVAERFAHLLNLTCQHVGELLFGNVLTMLNVELYFNMVHVRVHASVLGAFEEPPVEFRMDDVLLLLSFDEANMVVIYVGELTVIGFALLNYLIVGCYVCVYAR